MLHYLRSAAAHEHGKGIEHGVAWAATLASLASFKSPGGGNKQQGPFKALPLGSGRDLHCVWLFLVVFMCFWLFLVVFMCFWTWWGEDFQNDLRLVF